MKRTGSSSNSPIGRETGRQARDEAADACGIVDSRAKSKLGTMAGPA